MADKRTTSVSVAWLRSVQRNIYRKAGLRWSARPDAERYASHRAKMTAQGSPDWPSPSPRRLA